MKALGRLFLIMIGLLFLWQLLVTLTHMPNYILPSPGKVLRTLWQIRSILLPHAMITIVEIVLGFAIGIILGCMASLGLIFFRKLALWFLPLVIISQAIPTFAIAPLLVIWLGYGLASKIATAGLMIFFPITSAFYDGLQKQHPALEDLAHIMQAENWRSFLFLRLPLALPSLASGIRIAAVIAPIGAIIGEWVGASQGLGYLMLNANARLQIDVVFAALIVIIVLTLTLYFVIDWLLKKCIWWQSL